MALSVTILFVDSNPDDVDTLATALADDVPAFDVVTETDPADAVARLDTLDVDCVISSYNFPETDGITFLQSVRDEHPDLPFILYTGEGSEAVASEAISAGVTDYVRQDATADPATVLANRVHNAVERLQNKREADRNQRRLETLISNLPGMVYRCENTPKWPMEIVRGDCEQLTGYSAEALEEGSVIWGEEILHPDDKEDMWEAVQDAITDDRPFEVTYRIITADGNTKWMWERGRKVFSAVDGETKLEGFITDITDQKRREAQLQRKERRYQALFDDPNILVALTDTDGTLLDVNQTAIEYVPADQADIVGMPLWESPWFRYSETLQEDIKDWIDRAAAGEYVEFGADIDPSIGESATVEGVFRPVTDEDGEVVSLLISTRDISARVEHARQLRTLIGNLPGVAYRCYNEEGWPMELIRGQCAELVGYTEQQITEGDISWGEDIIHPDDQEMVWDEIQAAIEANEQFELTYRVRTSSGDKRWVWERGQVVSPHDADELMLEGFISDITERKQLQKELEASKERYESLFLNIQDAIVVTDTEQRITNCNPAFTEIFGYELAEIAGKPTKTLFEDEAEYDELVEEFQSADNNEEFMSTVEFQMKSGQPFPGEMTISTIHNHDGTLVGYIGVIRDITDRQERLRQIQIIDRVLRHNLRNDLSVVLSLADQIRTTGSPEVTSSATKIREKCDDILNTTDKEREITRYLVKSWPTISQDGVTMVRSTAESIRERYPDADLTLDLPDEQRLLAIKSFSDAIEELLENAVVHSDRAEPSITVSLESAGEFVIVEIADDGPGIPEEDRRILLGERDIDPLYHGSGLGLWLVDLEVRRSGGSLEFLDNEPRGTIVRIRLPAD